jgi:tRNA(Arg) A34 adenosine deaminase TadA
MLTSASPQHGITTLNKLVHNKARMRIKAANAEQAVRIAASKSIEASLQNTFAVGGVLVHNRRGTVFCALHNNVLESYEDSKLFLLHDPTAHGERQIVDWYFKNRKRLNLPDPSELTVITTLDPCAMCAGALLTGGFNVGVSGADDYAGINYNASFDFPSVPAKWKKVAQSSFAYYGVDVPVRRAFQGGKGPAFARQSISAFTYCLTETIFESSVNSVRALDNNSGKDPSSLKNPKSLPSNSKVRKALQDECSEAFSVICPEPRLPGKEIASALLNAAKKAHRRGAAFNSVVFLDPFGNLLLCSGGAEERSPIRTAFMEVTRAYAHVRWVLMNHSEKAVREQAGDVLTHPKFGTFVFLYSPDPNTPQGLMAMGAYGSTMEGPIPESFPSNMQYVLLPEGVSQAEVSEMAMRLPPFYTTSVQVAPAQVLDEELIEEAREAVSEHAAAA